MRSAGITRVHIMDVITGAGAWRFREAQARWPAANALYRGVFAALRMPLLPGDEEIECDENEFNAGYDKFLGIDVILCFTSGMEVTLQEKFLFTRYKTVTVEYMQDWRSQEQGDWFHMKAQYYFVGYDRIRALSFQDWILLDWAAAQRATSAGQIVWHELTNRQDGARASFRYMPFDEFPLSCIVACSDTYQRAKQITLPLC